MSASHAPTSISRILPPGAVGPVAPRPRPLVGTGLTSPEFLAFRRRLEPILKAVCELVPRAHEADLRAGMLAAALNEKGILAASDEQLSAFLLYAARTFLMIGKELTPLLDIDERTGAVSLVPFESIKGLQRLMKEAGARSVMTGTVYATDRFKCNVGGGMKQFDHDPNLTVSDRGPVTSYYALVDLPKYDWVARVLSVREVKELQSASSGRNHPSWTNYFNHMGEICALRAVAALVEQGHRNPAMRGWSAPDPGFKTTPMELPDEPYGPPPARPKAPPTPETVDADYEILGDDQSEREPLFRDAADAAREKLPGRGDDFGGCGGRRIGGCSDAILRGVLKWIELKDSRAVTYARLKAAISLVLTARRANSTPTPEDQTP